MFGKNWEAYAPPGRCGEAPPSSSSRVLASTAAATATETVARCSTGIWPPEWSTSHRCRSNATLRGGCMLRLIPCPRSDTLKSHDRAQPRPTLLGGIPLTCVALCRPACCLRKRGVLPPSNNNNANFGCILMRPSVECGSIHRMTTYSSPAIITSALPTAGSAGDSPRRG